MLRRFGAIGCSGMVRGAATSPFVQRHIGPSIEQEKEMLSTLGFKDLEEMMASILPKDIARPALKEVDGLSEDVALAHLRGLMGNNRVLKSLIGQGYYESITPPVIVRNILENPGWYTPYTPYQAEISQGRLRSLLNFQTMITDITKMEFANASLLDQATAAAEAMSICVSSGRRKVFVHDKSFPSVIEMLKTRAEPLGIDVIVGDPKSAKLDDPALGGIIVQTPDATGAIHDFSDLFAKAKSHDVVPCCGTDLLACCVIKPPGEMGAEIVFGTAQRFGIPLGFGGPHAAFFAVSDKHKRNFPGRLIGVSKTVDGNTALRMALQTREQHIKRDRATSNICTAQALLANMSAFYAIYHGAEGLTEIAQSVHTKAKAVAVGLESLGHKVITEAFFDTITVKLEGLTPEMYSSICTDKGINVYTNVAEGTVSLSMDEATSSAHVVSLLEAAGMRTLQYTNLVDLAKLKSNIPEAYARKSAFLTAKVFRENRCESELMRLINRYRMLDYGLSDGMIPLGSCTMKLNAAATMIPMSWPELNNVHPLVPEEQSKGYEAMLLDLEQKLRDVTGFAAVSLQPNSGAQGEYAGLRVIQAYHHAKGEKQRNVCLIPESAHGTNPASAAKCGLRIVVVKCLKDGSIDLHDLEAQCEKNAKNLSCGMITYPSTYGVFDVNIKTITSLIHKHGGQVYIDGANLNAMVGYTSPFHVGGDVCHVNMHKTFGIPHGGGGPGMGPIGVREHLAPFLPNTAIARKVGGSHPFGQSSQAPYGSASILAISYMLMTMLGSHGLKKCTAMAILNANYLRKRLESHFPILFVGHSGMCAHEFIIDLRGLEKTSGVKAEDVSKRLMDYGFHSPTLSFPVAGTLMVEPTESESKQELDRFCDAMISIRQEIADIEGGKQPRENNILKNAPHTSETVTALDWTRPYSRQQAAFPSPFTKKYKFWPHVSRIDNVHGDRNLMCSCAPLDDYVEK